MSIPTDEIITKIDEIVKLYSSTRDCLIFGVIPAKAGIQFKNSKIMDSRFHGNDILTSKTENETALSSIRYY
jgi:hypothetical protein